MGRHRTGRGRSAALKSELKEKRRAARRNRLSTFRSDTTELDTDDDTVFPELKGTRNPSITSTRLKITSSSPIPGDSETTGHLDVEDPTGVSERLDTPHS